MYAYGACVSVGVGVCEVVCVSRCMVHVYVYGICVGMRVGLWCMCMCMVYVYV